MEMVKVKVTIVLLLIGTVLSAQNISWEKVHMDASRTGATLPDKDNVEQALGRVEGDTYYAPNGKVYTGGSLPEVARLMIEAQPSMAPVKEIVGYSSHMMPRGEDELPNMIVDRLMVTAQEKTGVKVDVGIINRGGIRYDMPEGKVIVDDIVSMLPFKNYICVATMSGKSLREKLEDIATRRVAVLGGVEMTVKDKQIKKLRVGGKRLRDNRLYNVATVDFLLEGGDGISVAKDAVDLIQTDVLIRDSFISYLHLLSSGDRTFSYDNNEKVKQKNYN